MRIAGHCGIVAPMYIRCTQTRSNATGEHYFTYRLVRSERIAGKVKRVTLLNLGRHFSVAQTLWPALYVRIEELMAEQACLVDVDLPKAKALAAGRIVEQLQLHRPPAHLAPATPAESERKPEPAPASGTEVQAVDVNSLELVRLRSVGVEHIGLWAMLQVSFVDLLIELGISGPVYHHKEIRVDGHLFITVLAYQFVQIIGRQLQEHGIQGRWSSLREILSVQRRVTASFQRADGGVLHVRKATRLEPELAAIYQAHNVDPLP